MAQLKHLADVDMQGNKLVNVRLEALSTPPATGSQGRILFDSTELILKYYKDSSTSAIGVQKLLSTATTTDSLSLSVTDGLLTINVADANGTDSGLISASDWTLLSGSTELATAGSIVKRDGNGQASFSQLSVSSAPTLPEHTVSKQYLDSMLPPDTIVIDGDVTTSYALPPATGSGDTHTIALIDIEGKKYNKSTINTISGSSFGLMNYPDGVWSTVITGAQTHPRVGFGALLFRMDQTTWPAALTSARARAIDVLSGDVIFDLEMVLGSENSILTLTANSPPQNNTGDFRIELKPIGTAVDLESAGPIPLYGTPAKVSISFTDSWWPITTNGTETIDGERFHFPRRDGVITFNDSAAGRWTSDASTDLDSVETYNFPANFPSAGSLDKIYISKMYRRAYFYHNTHNKYYQIGEIGETMHTAHRGDHGTAAYAHSELTSGNPHNLVKSDIDLGNVNNTSDINKPISTLVQSALDAKGSGLVVRAGQLDIGPGVYYIDPEEEEEAELEFTLPASTGSMERRVISSNFTDDYGKLQTDQSTLTEATTSTYTVGDQASVVPAAGFGPQGNGGPTGHTLIDFYSVSGGHIYEIELRAEKISDTPTTELTISIWERSGSTAKRLTTVKPYKNVTASYVRYRVPLDTYWSSTKDIGIRAVANDGHTVKILQQSSNTSQFGVHGPKFKIEYTEEPWAIVATGGDVDSNPRGIFPGDNVTTLVDTEYGWVSSIGTKKEDVVVQSVTRIGLPPIGVKNKIYSVINDKEVYLWNENAAEYYSTRSTDSLKDIPGNVDTGPGRYHLSGVTSTEFNLPAATGSGDTRIVSLRNYDSGKTKSTDISTVGQPTSSTATVTVGTHFVLADGATITSGRIGSLSIDLVLPSIVADQDLVIEIWNETDSILMSSKQVSVDFLSSTVTLPVDVEWDGSKLFKAVLVANNQGFDVKLQTTDITSFGGASAKMALVYMFSPWKFTTDVSSTINDRVNIDPGSEGIFTFTDHAIGEWISDLPAERVWHFPDLGSYSYLDGILGVEKLSFSKEGNSIRVRGTIRPDSPGSDNIICILPHDYRPDATVIIVASNESGPKSVKIRPDGVVQLLFSGSSSTWISFDGITYTR